MCMLILHFFFFCLGGESTPLEHLTYYIILKESESWQSYRYLPICLYASGTGKVLDAVILRKSLPR